MKRIRRIQTNEKQKIIWKEEVYAPKAQEDCMHVVNLYPDVTFQTIQGFGGAFTEASAHVFYQMDNMIQEQILEDYFGEYGLQYNMGRIAMNSCDFGLGNYSYIKENDTALDTFDISHDDKEIIPFIQKAMEKQKEWSSCDMKMLMSPWSPPAFMKTNGDMNHGGKLLPEYADAWARYYVRFIEEYAKRGIEIKRLTVQNEPDATQTWDSCRYTAKEEAEFVGEYLGPILEKAGMKNIDIFVWDHNKETLYERVKEIMSNEKAARYVKGAGIHWYTGDHFEAIELVKKQYPECQILFTEGCVEYSRFADSRESQKAEMYAHDILGNLKAGVEGYMDWNLILDEKGGPNHVGNYCAAPIMCNCESGEYTKRLMYYYIGHFSRYIARGAKRIGTSSYTDKVEVVAFQNPDQTRVAVLLNRTDQEVPITLKESGQGIELQLAPHSIETIIYDSDMITA